MIFLPAQQHFPAPATAAPGPGGPGAHLWLEKGGGTFVSRILSPTGRPADQRSFLYCWPRGPQSQSRDRVRRTRDYPDGLAPSGSGRLPVFPVCLAPRRVFRAPGLAARGGGLLPRLFTLAHPPLRAGGGLFSVTLSVSGRFHDPLPAFITRHAALWCPDFPPRATPKSSPRRPFRVPPLYPSTACHSPQPLKRGAEGRGQRAERAEAATKQFYGWLLHQASIGAETVVRAVPSAVKRTEKTGK